MARDFQGRTRTKNNPTHHGRGPHRRPRFERTPRTIRPAPNRRARFNPARTHRSGRHDFKKELYVNARASAGQGLATIQDKRGRGHPPKWKRWRDSWQRPLNAATPKAAQAAESLAGANAQTAAKVAAKTAAPMNDKLRHGVQTTAANTPARTREK